MFATTEPYRQYGERSCGRKARKRHRVGGFTFRMLRLRLYHNRKRKTNEMHGVFAGKQEVCSQNFLRSKKFSRGYYGRENATARSQFSLCIFRHNLNYYKTLHFNLDTQKYPRGSRGSPAKGVVLENGSTSSNLVFCASKNLS